MDPAERPGPKGQKQNSPGQSGVATRLSAHYPRHPTWPRSVAPGNAVTTTHGRAQESPPHRPATEAASARTPHSNSQPIPQKGAKIAKPPCRSRDCCRFRAEKQHGRRLSVSPFTLQTSPFELPSPVSIEHAPETFWCPQHSHDTRCLSGASEVERQSSAAPTRAVVERYRSAAQERPAVLRAPSFSNCEHPSRPSPRIRTTMPRCRPRSWLSSHPTKRRKTRTLSSPQGPSPPNVTLHTPRTNPIPHKPHRRFY